jgi:hypothetical protein
VCHRDLRHDASVLSMRTYTYSRRMSVGEPMGLFGGYVNLPEIGRLPRRLAPLLNSCVRHSALNFAPASVHRSAKPQ